MQKTRVAVLRGGPSDSYDESLDTGGHVLRSLPTGFEGIDVLIDKRGVWHEMGFPSAPESILKRADVAWNALHGSYGADGTVQNIIRHFGVPYSGPEAFSAAMASNPTIRNEAYARVGIRAPQRKEISFTNDIESFALDLFRTFPMPAIISFSSKSIAPIPVQNFHELHDALIRAQLLPGKSFIEEYIPGKAAGCGVIEGFRGQMRYALLPFQYSPSNHSHPGIFSSEEKKALESAALAAHDALGLRHYSLSHFIVHPKRGVYMISTESLPPLDRGSHFENSLHAIGADVPQFLGHVIELAREGR